MVRWVWISKKIIILDIALQKFYSPSDNTQLRNFNTLIYNIQKLLWNSFLLFPYDVERDVQIYYCYQVSLEIVYRKFTNETMFVLPSNNTDLPSNLTWERHLLEDVCSTPIMVYPSFLHCFNQRSKLFSLHSITVGWNVQ